MQQILDEDGPTAFPGVYDTLSAKIAERLGFHMAFIVSIPIIIDAPGFGGKTAQYRPIDWCRPLENDWTDRAFL